MSMYIVHKLNLRGERCKFKHPADKKEGDEKIPFCNDFRQVCSETLEILFNK